MLRLKYFSRYLGLIVDAATRFFLTTGALYMYTTLLTELHETFDQWIDVFELQQEVQGRRGPLAQCPLVASIRRRALNLATRLDHFAIGCIFSNLSSTPNCLNEK